MDRLKAPFRVANTLALFMIAYAMLVNPSSAAPNAGPLAAPMSPGFEYHGRLNNVTGLYDFKFRLFNAATGGAQVYGVTAAAMAVPVNGGQYRTVLRFGEGIRDILAGEALFVDVQYRVATTNPNAPYTLQTGDRAQLMPQAYAMSLRPGATVRGNVAGAGLFVRNTGSGTGVAGQSNGGAGTTGQSTSWYGVYGLSGTQAGVMGQSTSWVGVHGLSSTQSGVWGKSTSGAGLWGESTSGAGVYGRSSSWIGVHGESTSQTAMLGESTTATGVWGVSRDWIGVFGQSNQNDGVSGTTQAAGRSGVYGVNNNGSGYGVFGSSTNGRGVAGQSTSNAGVTGTSATSTGVSGQSTSGSGTTGLSNSWYGVYGQSNTGAGVVGNSSTGYAMVAQGNATQSLAGGGFVKAMALIDPLDGADPVKQCFNSQLPGAQATSGNCGITADNGSACNFTRKINFGFNVENRFISVMPFDNGSGSIGANIVALGPQGAVVQTFYVLDRNNGNFAQTTCARFFIYVY